MRLGNAEILDLLRKPKNGRGIKLAEIHESRIRLHTEVCDEKSEVSQPAFGKFMRFVENILPEDKASRFKDLLTFPLQTTALTDSIFTEISRIFESGNYFEKYDFTSQKYENDFDTYLDKKGYKDFWKQNVYEEFRYSVNSILVCDLPTNQNTPKPEPYYYLLNISNVVDIDVDSDNNTEYIIFRISDEQICVIDELSYRTFSYVDSRLKLLSESEHDLGYTPARFIRNKNLKRSNPIQKRSLISKSLGDLDWLLFHKTNKKYLDLYASYPIYVGYESEEDYESADGNAENPNTKKRGEELIGSGSYLEVPAPQDGEVDLNRNPIQVIPAEKNSLEYNVAEEKRLQAEIYGNSIGSKGELRNDAAKNEAQLEDAYESRMNVLLEVKSDFEIIQKFANDTLARLRYGGEFLSSTIDYGNEFYLRPISDLYKNFSEAKTSGSSLPLLEDFNEQIRQTRFKNNKYMLTRSKIVSDLDPFPLRSETEVLTMYDKGLVDQKDMLIKVYLLSFIKQFEREQGSLVEFASLVDYNSKITIIQQILKTYADGKSVNSSKQESEVPNTGERE